MDMNGAAQIEETATQLQHNSQKTEKLNSQIIGQASLLTVALPRSYLVSALLTYACDSLPFLMPRKVDDGDNFVFVQLIGQKPGIYHKCHADYARRDTIEWAWERISHKVKESGSWLSSFEIKNYNHALSQTNTPT
jgi:hypothetical protein